MEWFEDDPQRGQAALTVAALVIAVAGLWFGRKKLLVAGPVVFLFLLLACFETPSAGNFALTLSRLGPDTPFESYTAEFGEPMHHFTDVELMKSWGPRTDDVLLTKTELYYFGYWGLPHRYVAVYIDRDTRHSVVVTWKYM